MYGKGGYIFRFLYLLSFLPVFRFEPNTPAKEDESETLVCWEATVIFYVSSFQYLILCITYSPGKPFRKSLITNGASENSVLYLWSYTYIIILCYSICFFISFTVHNHLSKLLGARSGSVFRICQISKLFIRAA